MMRSGFGFLVAGLLLLSGCAPAAPQPRLLGDAVSRFGTCVPSGSRPVYFGEIILSNEGPVVAMIDSVDLVDASNVTWTAFVVPTDDGALGNSLNPGRDASPAWHWDRKAGAIGAEVGAGSGPVNLVTAVTLDDDQPTGGSTGVRVSYHIGSSQYVAEYPATYLVARNDCPRHWWPSPSQTG